MNSMNILSSTQTNGRKYLGSSNPEVNWLRLACQLSWKSISSEERDRIPYIRSRRMFLEIATNFNIPKAFFSVIPMYFWLSTIVSYSFDLQSQLLISTSLSSYLCQLGWPKNELGPAPWSEESTLSVWNRYLILAFTKGNNRTTLVSQTTDT